MLWGSLLLFFLSNGQVLQSIYLILSTLLQVALICVLTSILSPQLHRAPWWAFILPKWPGYKDIKKIADTNALHHTFEQWQRFLWLGRKDPPSCCLPVCSSLPKNSKTTQSKNKIRKSARKTETTSTHSLMPWRTGILTACALGEQTRSFLFQRTSKLALRINWVAKG